MKTQGRFTCGRRDLHSNNKNFVQSGSVFSFRPEEYESPMRICLFQSISGTPRRHSRQIAVCYPTTNGSSSLRAKEACPTVEMFVASVDEDLGDGPSNQHPRLKRSKSVHVPPPRHAAPQKLALPADEERSKIEKAVSAENRILKQELGMTSAELHDLKAELQDSQRLLRTREAEMTLLKAALAGRDINLRNTTAELMNAQGLIKQKDSELQFAYEQLTSNAQERGSIRKELTDVQVTLTDTRSELEEWTQKAGTKALGQLARPTDSERIDRGALSGSNGKALPLPILEALQDLQQLSNQLARDAKSDDKALKL